MAKLNEGYVIEGIFTIALALHIAYGKIEKPVLNKIRTKIDPKMFHSGRVNYTIAKDIKRQKGKEPPDYFTVGVQLEVKTEKAGAAFGKDFNVLYKKARDIGNLNKKIDNLLRGFISSSARRKIDGAINKFLLDNTGQLMTFIVVSEGAEGEKSGGTIKGDVKLVVYGQAGKGNRKRLLGLAVPFSLKSDSATVGNLSPYYGMLGLASALGVKWKGVEKYARLNQRFTTPAEKLAKRALIIEMFSELKEEVIKASKAPGFSKNAFKFLHTGVFGSDMADVINIGAAGFHEISADYFDRLSKDTTLVAEEKGNNLMFIDKKTRATIFYVRAKVAAQTKFYLEVGRGIYDTKK